MKYRVLLVDEDDHFVNAVVMTLGQDFELQTACSLTEFKTKFHQDTQVDLLIVDYKSKSVDGFETLHYARKIRPKIPVIIVTACASKEIVIRALNLNVSAFFEKPIDFFELVDAIYKSIIRAAKEDTDSLASANGQNQSMAVFSVGPFTLCPANLSLSYHGNACQITATEFRILHAMICTESKRITREELIRTVWGNTNLSTNLFDTHLLNLRRKIPQLKSHLRVVRGKGYIFNSVIDG